MLEMISLGNLNDEIEVEASADARKAPSSSEAEFHSASLKLLMITSKQVEVQAVSSFCP